MQLAFGVSPFPPFLTLSAPVTAVSLGFSTKQIAVILAIVAVALLAARYAAPAQFGLAPRAAGK